MPPQAPTLAAVPMAFLWGGGGPVDGEWGRWGGGGSRVHRTTSAAVAMSPAFALASVDATQLWPQSPGREEVLDNRTTTVSPCPCSPPPPTSAPAHGPSPRRRAFVCAGTPHTYDDRAWHHVQAPLSLVVHM